MTSCNSLPMMIEIERAARCWKHLNRPDHRGTVGGFYMTADAGKYTKHAPAGNPEQIGAAA